MNTLWTSDEVRQLVELARREDMGGDDVTSRLLIEAGAVGSATLVQRTAGVPCGLPLVAVICAAYDSRLEVLPLPGEPLEAVEGRYSAEGRRPLLRIAGPMRPLLSAERIILNFLQHLSGVATATHRFVQEVAGTRARIYDTRKTLPGMRRLEKYAVVCGGGCNHRMGLYDGLLVKDNHLAGVPLDQLASFVERIVRQARAESADRLVEVEVDSLDQFGQVLKVPGIDVVLLDNMDCAAMKAAVELRDAAGLRGRLDLEASGGVNLQTVRQIALCGVDRIAIGAITHSAPALDIGLDIA